MGIFGQRKADKTETKDPVCGMLVVEEFAVGPEESATGAVWFCSVGCQAKYQADHAGTTQSEEGVEA
jgi:YHS domain-containing protein